MFGQQINCAREHATLSINDQIATWLDGLGLAQYAPVFAESAIDLDILPDLTEADLEKLGVALGHRKRILGQSLRFQREEPRQTTPPSHNPRPRDGS